jgi:hypothetical protein
MESVDYSEAMGLLLECGPELSIPADRKLAVWDLGHDIQNEGVVFFRGQATHHHGDEPIRR